MLVQNSPSFSFLHNKLPMSPPSIKEPALKTANPNIFPSLNPMGNFYKNHQRVQPPVLIRKETFDLPEPVKKQRLLDGLEKLVPQKSSPKTLERQVKKIQCEKNVDKDGFGVPKLPKRMIKNEKPSSSSTSLKKEKASTESLTMTSKDLHLQILNGQLSDDQASHLQLLNSMYEKLRLDFQIFMYQQNVNNFLNATQDYSKQLGPLFQGGKTDNWTSSLHVQEEAQRDLYSLKAKLFG